MFTSSFDQKYLSSKAVVSYLINQIFYHGRVTTKFHCGCPPLCHFMTHQYHLCYRPSCEAYYVTISNFQYHTLAQCCHDHDIRYCRALDNNLTLALYCTALSSITAGIVALSIKHHLYPNKCCCSEHYITCNIVTTNIKQTRNKIYAFILTTNFFK